MKIFKVTIIESLVNLYKEQFGASRKFFLQAESEDVARSICMSNFDLDNSVVVEEAMNISSSVIRLSKPENFSFEEITAIEFDKAIGKIRPVNINGTFFWFQA